MIYKPRIPTVCGDPYLLAGTGLRVDQQGGAGFPNDTHADLPVFDLSDDNDHIWTGAKLSPAFGAEKEVGAEKKGKICLRDFQLYFLNQSTIAGSKVTF